MAYVRPLDPMVLREMPIGLRDAAAGGEELDERCVMLLGALNLGGLGLELRAGEAADGEDRLMISGDRRVGLLELDVERLGVW